MYVIELACSVRIGNILVEFFFFFFFGSLWTSPSARAINFQNDFHNVIFAEVLPKL